MDNKKIGIISKISAYIGGISISSISGIVGIVGFLQTQDTSKLVWVLGFVVALFIVYYLLNHSNLNATMQNITNAETLNNIKKYRDRFLVYVKFFGKYYCIGFAILFCFSLIVWLLLCLVAWLYFGVEFEYLLDFEPSDFGLLKYIDISSDIYSLLCFVFFPYSLLRVQKIKSKISHYAKNFFYRLL